MPPQTLTGRLVLPEGVVPGRLTFDTHLRRLQTDAAGATGPLILPGFIDTHVHGGGGGDTMDGPEGVRALGRLHLQHGTTTLLPTTLTSPWERLLAALEGVQEVRAASGVETDLPDLPGVHLEGPFINPERLGAQPPYAIDPTPERIDAVLGSGVVRVVTLAPELPGARDAARRFAEAGVRVSVGHTAATFEQVAALAAVVREAGGTLGFTHLYNAMGGLTGRDPGVVGAALADAAAYSELILDLHHVHPGGFLAALAAKPDRLHLVTDGIRACGLGEGKTTLGGQPVTVRGGAARLPDGTLAGSVLTLDAALRNAVAAGVALACASRLLSETPARYLGLTDRGRLGVGLRADLVVMSEQLEVTSVYRLGQRVR
jgi:N-acetylglucosamine-6-phosphate deacetylase